MITAGISAGGPDKDIKVSVSSSSVSVEDTKNKKKYRLDLSAQNESIRMSLENGKSKDELLITRGSDNRTVHKDGKRTELPEEKDSFKAAVNPYEAAAIEYARQMLALMDTNSEEWKKATQLSLKLSEIARDR